MTTDTNPTAVTGQHVNFIWSIAETLRGNYKQSEYRHAVLPFTILCRLDCMLEASRSAVLQVAKTYSDGVDDAMSEFMLNEIISHKTPA